MRIGGLASGIDTDSIIRDMMNANRIPLTKITQKKQYLDWQVDDFRAVNRQLTDFSNMTWDTLLNPTTSAFRKKTVEVSSPDAVSIKSLGANDVSGSIEIHQLAKNATLQGSGLSVNGEKLSKEEFEQTRLTTFSGNGGTSIKIEVPGGKEGGTEITFGSTATMKTVLDRLNDELGVNAFYDEQTGKIAMTAKNSGEGDIEISGDLAAGLGFSTVTKTTGQDADFTFNGLRTQRSSNSFEIGGFEVTLKQVTSPLESGNEVDSEGNRKVAAGGQAVNFSSTANTDEIFDSIVKYVDEYNKLIEDLNKQIREPKYRNFQPLSAEEKSDMKENEIKLWEEKAMSGTLRNDPTITSMLSKMRLALTGAMGENGSLKDIGIKTSSDYLANGKLVIDEDALKKAIQEDPKKVEAMFNSNSGVKGVAEKDQGFAVRVRGIVEASQGTITDRAGSIGSANDTFSLGRTLKDMDKQIERFEERMKMVEDRLWRQFSAMEAAINRANAQSAQLMNALGGGM